MSTLALLYNLLSTTRWLASGPIGFCSRGLGFSSGGRSADAGGPIGDQELTEAIGKYLKDAHLSDQDREETGAYLRRGLREMDELEKKLSEDPTMNSRDLMDAIFSRPTLKTLFVGPQRQINAPPRQVRLALAAPEVRKHMRGHAFRGLVGAWMYGVEENDDTAHGDPFLEKNVQGHGVQSCCHGCSAPFWLGCGCASAALLGGCACGADSARALAANEKNRQIASYNPFANVSRILEGGPLSLIPQGLKKWFSSCKGKDLQNQPLLGRQPSDGPLSFGQTAKEWRKHMFATSEDSDSQQGESLSTPLLERSLDVHSNGDAPAEKNPSVTR